MDKELAGSTHNDCGARHLLSDSIFVPKIQRPKGNVGINDIVGSNWVQKLFSICLYISANTHRCSICFALHMSAIGDQLFLHLICVYHATASSIALPLPCLFHCVVLRLCGPVLLPFKRHLAARHMLVQLFALYWSDSVNTRKIATLFPQSRLQHNRAWSGRSFYYRCRYSLLPAYIFGGHGVQRAQRR